MVVDELSRRIQLNHLEAIISCELELGECVKHAGKHDEKYHQIKENLQQDGEDGND